MKTLYVFQAMLCALIAIRLLFFRRHGAAHRPWAARLAYALIVMSGAVAIGVAFERYEWALLALNGITAILCVSIYAVRGNVVELFRITGLDPDGDGESLLLRLLRRTSHDATATR
ncbi:Putative 3TM holin, Phage_holin_3 [Ralstonia sp. 25mfcol4.1]|uniref:phage holin family protein n=1 Tax=Ralstonia sp. 25mfcol4.1 TaxID=1761899 RepID=UPI000885B12D|nr:phage holin family protein [Ralstonia sp. 25mfcol4.1]SDP46214.1 Putative 3TM holin, Phage_holin_3 [Ralstonia sp. 25mfcol4.1]